MKRTTLILCALMFALSVGAQPRQLRLHVFGSQHSGPTNALLKEIEANPGLKQRLAELEYAYLDGDKPDAEANPAYRYMAVTGTREFPQFFVSDAEGNVVKSAVGYESAEKLLAWLDAADLAARGMEVRPGDISDRGVRRMERRQKRGGSVTERLSYSPWRIEVEGGALMSSLIGPVELDGYKAGWYAGAFAKRLLPWEMRAGAGLTLQGTGGRWKRTVYNVRLNYLTLPVDLERTIVKPLIFRDMGVTFVNLGVGVYGSRLLSEKASVGPTPGFDKWDAGVRLRVSVVQGTFGLNAGWTRGLRDIAPGPDRVCNNAFTLGISITLGD